VNLGWLLRLLNGIRRFSHLHDIVPGGLVIIPPNTFFVSFVATTKMQSSGTISFRNERKKERLTAARKKHRKWRATKTANFAASFKPLLVCFFWEKKTKKNRQRKQCGESTSKKRDLQSTRACLPKRKLPERKPGLTQGEFFHNETKWASNRYNYLRFLAAMCFFLRPRHH
jgi:hypothetical protein